MAAARPKKVQRTVTKVVDATVSGQPLKLLTSHLSLTRFDPDEVRMELLVQSDALMEGVDRERLLQTLTFPSEWDPHEVLNAAATWDTADLMAAFKVTKTGTLISSLVTMVASIKEARAKM